MNNFILTSRCPSWSSW